ncbi:MFS transporter [Alicyclobacillus fastidiosus]|uniref:MFS transporter n=1 Tax=Alicyclobacillus fastidiosus TaxID=392011 RepID=A0ABV5ABD5_9BACL|nr:MFS transporter [Alicyclobacillus fastidiosus]WEH10456.1 MFS transporter [Alicyclobacillus fastidiosus]
MFGRYWKVVVLMLFLAQVINYLDRSAFSVAAPIITKQLHFSPAELGILLSSFSVGYAVFNFVGGYLSDMYGPRRVYGGAMTLWSIFCGLTTLGFNFASMFIIRLIFGIGEGPLATTTNKTLTNWVPKAKHAGAVGIANAGSPLGGAIAGPIVGLIAVYSSWKVSFLAITIIGLLWAVVWLRIVKDHPRQHSKVSPEELQEIEQGKAWPSGVSNAIKIPLSHYLKQPTVLFTAVAFFTFNYILFFFLTWFPSYLSIEKHLSIKNISIATSIPWIVGTVGVLLSGWISDYIYKKTKNLMFSRKVVLVVGLLGAAVCVGLAGLAQTPVSAVVLMTIGIFFMYITGAIYWSIISDNVATERVGGVGGFIHAIANVSGIIAPTVTGVIVQSTGSFVSAFLVAGILAIVGAVCVMLFVRPMRDTSARRQEPNHMSV